MKTFKKLALPVLVVLFLVTLSAGVVVLVLSVVQDGIGAEIKLEDPATPGPLKVYITGAVREPGVYVVDDGLRVQDAITMAGGHLDGAQLACLNLAIRVSDEAHYHLPGQDEPCNARGSSFAATGGQGIDLNSASPEELESLPGIGEVKAGDIVEHRDTIGGFVSVEQVMEVRGIGPATYEAIKDLVYVGEFDP